MPKIKDTVRVTVTPMSDLDVKVHRCERCHKAFKTSNALGAHKWKSHGIAGKGKIPEQAVATTVSSIWTRIDPRLRVSVRTYLAKYHLTDACVQVDRTDGRKVIIRNTPTDKTYVDIN